MKKITKYIEVGIISGIIWGLMIILVTYFINVFSFESSLLHNIVTFSAGGVLFGLITSAFLYVLQERLPFEHIIPKAILVSASLWGTLGLTGILLALVSPDRYHINTSQTFQGLFLAILLGGILGFFWKKEEL